MKETHIVVDLQFGSTGKGLLSGYLAERYEPDTIITAWGPNAGHTYINAAGRKFVNIALPNGIVSPKLKRILIGPGSVINPERFMWEMKEYEDLLKGVTIMIHPNAAVVMEKHRLAEAQYGFAIGSTMKGVGEAICQKIRRQQPLNTANFALIGTSLEDLVVTHAQYDNAVDDAVIALVEGAQGFSLGINGRFYPHCTSRDCSIQQLMVDCALPLGRHLQPIVHGTCRTYPIRVANRFSPGGLQVGTSGGCYEDQEEITWGGIGREAELTTVTKLPRRIFTFSPQQIHEALRMNGCNDVFLNFCNYVGPGRDLDAIIEQIDFPVKMVRWLGWGPTVTDIQEQS